MSRELKVKLHEKSYQIHWESPLESLRNSLLETIREHAGRQVLMVDENVAGLYTDWIQSTFENLPVIVIPSGESSKTMKKAEELLEQCLDLGLDRGSRIYALGGGVTGDISGFVAAIYMRGIEFVQIPTTLLAMVDSSVGGKTGVNLKKGKNMVGAFHQPVGVHICVDFLQTLPKREITCGLAEVVKSALIRNHMFFRYIEDHVPAILNQEPEVMETLSYESVKVKAAIVEKDEKESGLRALLNFGHTLAHGIEAAFGYEEINHGEAVAVGMEFAALYSFRKGFLTEKEYRRIYELLENLLLTRYHILKRVKVPDVETIVKFMRNDKKNRNHKIRFVFLKGIGSARLPEPVDEAELIAVLKEFWES